MPHQITINFLQESIEKLKDEIESTEEQLEQLRGRMERYKKTNHHSMLNSSYKVKSQFTNTIETNKALITNIQQSIEVLKKETTNALPTQPT